MNTSQMQIEPWMREAAEAAFRYIDNAEFAANTDEESIDVFARYIAEHYLSGSSPEIPDSWPVVTRGELLRSENEARIASGLEPVGNCDCYRRADLGERHLPSCPANAGREIARKIAVLLKRRTEGAVMPPDWTIGLVDEIASLLPDSSTTVQPAGYAGLVDLLKWADGFIERCKFTSFRYTEYDLRMHAGIKQAVKQRALAAAEAGKGE